MKKSNYLKYVAKKLCGQYLPFYKESNKVYKYLKSVVPSFMEKSLLEKNFNKKLLIASMGWYDAKTEAIYAKAYTNLRFAAIQKTAGGLNKLLEMPVASSDPAKQFVVRMNRDTFYSVGIVDLSKGDV